jgi:SAM-dependent methyltransferase
MLNHKAKKSKWEESSQFEREWWTKWKSRTDLSLAHKELIERANHIKQIIDPFYPSDLRKILQIGPGANAEIHFLSGDRFAIDPLAPYFKENFSLFIDPKVNFIQGMAEKLPYPDSFFDVILILNVLDHCWEPLTVLEEIARCLHSNGILILHVNIYNQTASALHSLFQFLDKEHPHALTKRFLESHLCPHFEILEESWFPLNLPEQNKLKTTISVLLKTFHLFPSLYKGVLKRK